MSLRATLSMTVLISRTLLFELNVTLTSVFNFTVLLSYHTICVFLVQKFSCSVATHGYEPSLGMFSFFPSFGCLFDTHASYLLRLKVSLNYVR